MKKIKIKIETSVKAGAYPMYGIVTPKMPVVLLYGIMLG